MHFGGVFGDSDRHQCKNMHAVCKMVQVYRIA